MKIMRIVGARPQFMQIPAFSTELASRGGTQLLVHTGQHYDDNMSKVFFHQLGLPAPDLNLEVGSGLHGAQTGAMLTKIEEAIIEHRPTVVVTDGDTNSTVAGTLASRKLGVPTVHIEAGVRCRIHTQPEEINRIATDHLSDLNLAPTPTGLANLASEGLANRSVFTGDVMLDCFIHYNDRADNAIIDKLNLKGNDYVLSTLHRAETTEDKELFYRVIDSIDEIGEKVIFPAHPRLNKLISSYVSVKVPRNISFIDPVGYFEMKALLKNARFIVTDSGGVSREGPFSGKRTIHVGNKTAWTDLVNRKYLMPWHPDNGSIAERLKLCAHPDIDEIYTTFGSGRAAGRIVDEIYDRFS